MSFASDTSSPLSYTRTSSPISEFQPSESECQEDSLAPEHSEVCEVNLGALSPPDTGAAHMRKKRSNPHPSSWVWGPPESPNGKSVTVDDIPYWQCARCPQKYPKSHGTKNPGMHLARAHSIHEEQSAKFKRLKQAQHSIQISMGEAAVRETRRARGSQRNIPRFPPHVAELSGTLYESNAYVARRNRLRTGALKAGRRGARAPRGLIKPTPPVRGTDSCAEVWRALEKCWGPEIADKAKVEVGLIVEGRGGDSSNRASEGSPPAQLSPSSCTPN